MAHKKGWVIVIGEKLLTDRKTKGLPRWGIHLPGQEIQETWARSLSQEDPLKKEMATHSSVLA